MSDKPTNEMRTAEEILNSVGCIYVSETEFTGKKEDLISVMEEYASSKLKQWDSFKNPHSLGCINHLEEIKELSSKLKEKDKEIWNLKMYISAQKIGVDYPAKISSLKSQLQASNAMAKLLAEALEICKNILVGNEQYEGAKSILEILNKYKNFKKG